MRIGFGATKYFAGDRRHLADAEEKELSEVGERVALGPFEVDVGADSGDVSDMK